MSLTRKTYDGDFIRGNNGSSKWGDTVDTESTANRNASTKRAKRTSRVPVVEENLFAEDGNDKDRYLITYADLITLLLGLFIILYAISNIDIQKYEKMMSAIGSVFGGANVINGESVGNEIAVPPIDELNSKIKNFVRDEKLSNSIAVVENERGLVLHIFDKILFPSGSAVLNEDAKQVLSKLALLIKELPNDIRIEGHTDNVPIVSSLYPSNWHLSVARALNTAYYLIESEHLNQDKVSIVGYSKFQPIATNNSPEGREKNRRVDIVIIK